MIDYQLVQDTIKQYIDKCVLQPTGLEPSQAKKLAVQLGVSSVVVYYIYRFLIYNLYLHPANRLPGPKTGKYPLMGNFLEIINEDAGDAHKRWTEKYGSLHVCHGPWNDPFVVVSDPVQLKQILTTQEYDFIKTPESADFLRRFLGNGLLTAEGDVHRRQRKMLNPAFSVSSIRSMTPLMAKPGYILRDVWLDLTKRGDNKTKTEDGQELTEIEISTGLSMATLDVIGWVLGQDFKSLEYVGTDRQSKLSQAYLHVFSTDLSFLKIMTFLFPILEWLPTAENRKTRRAVKWLNEESRALVQAGIDRAAMEKATGIKRSGPKDLLDTMIELRDDETNQGFTIEEIKNQCLTFLAAGHETTSVGLSWCLWLLAQNQKYQDELRKEVLTLFKDDDSTPTYEEVNALPFLNNVVRETLRLYPPVPITDRVTRVPVALGSHVIPKGTTIHLSFIVNHHSKEVWGEDAEEFNPYRWDTDKVGNAYQYLPFLAGGRQCIGYKFALIEFKILLAILIRKMQYFEKPGFKVSKRQQVTMRPFPDMRLLVKPL